VSTPGRTDASPDVLAGLDAWRDLPAAQQPVWPDAEALAAAVSTLSSYPPLVFAGECDVLKGRLAEAALGKAFVLQGGDCAETFASATADNIRDRIKTILQMAAVLTYGASMPVVKVGRIAGQYAKPRSKDTETRGEMTLPAYRGDMVNDFAFTPEFANPRSEPSRAGLQRELGDTQPGPGVHDRWFRRPAPRPRLEPRVHRQLGQLEVRAPGWGHRQGDEVHGRLWCRLRRLAHGGVLRQP